MQENISQKIKLESMTKITHEQKEASHIIENCQKTDNINQDPYSSEENSSKYKQRRPDKALYVPKALRSQRTVHRSDIQEKSNINVKTKKNPLSKSIGTDDTSLKSDLSVHCNSSSNEITEEFLETNLKLENNEVFVTAENDKILTKELHNKIDMPNSFHNIHFPPVSLNSENSVTECFKSISLNDNMKLSTNNINETIELDIEGTSCTNREAEKIENPFFNVSIASTIVTNAQSDIFHPPDSEFLIKTANQNSEPYPIPDPHIGERSKNKFCNNLLENDTLTLISSQSKIIHGCEIGDSKWTKEKDQLESNIFLTKVENSKRNHALSSKDDGWEALFTEDGDCLNPEFKKEQAEFGDLELCKTKQDHSEYQATNNTGSDEWSHIVELYDFPVEFKTQDLVSAFSVFQKDSYTIKWVDDCHALGIFSTPFIATEALDLKHPFIKFRPLSQGTKESKYKAKLCEYYNKPYTPRPATSATTARRMVSGALGLRVNMSKEQREYEHRVLIEAKERKRQKAKQKQDIWDGIIS